MPRRSSRTSGMEKAGPDSVWNCTKHAFLVVTTRIRLPGRGGFSSLAEDAALERLAQTPRSR